MAKHDERVEAIKEYMARYPHRVWTRPNYTAFECDSKFAAVKAQDYMSENRALYSRMLSWTNADTEYGVMILERRICRYCNKRWSEHAPAGGQCLFASTTYDEGPL